jgi:HEPN domain-containing protein
LSRRSPDELAATLARKADQDAEAVRQLVPNQLVADEIIGFHAQQAIEKWLKAVMAKRGTPQQRIHDLPRLAEVAEAFSLSFPLDRDALAGLTIYAVPLRYDELLDDPGIDRALALAQVEAVAAWAAGLIASG